VASRCPIDEELDDGLGVLGGLAPQLRRVTDDLIGIAPLGEADDVDVGP
jgi:hypothetical protein